jgi:hypothetical protein
MHYLFVVRIVLDDLEVVLKVVVEGSPGFYAIDRPCRRLDTVSLASVFIPSDITFPINCSVVPKASSDRSQRKITIDA